MGKKNKKKGNEAVAGTPASTAAAYMESAGRMHTLARKYPWFDGAVIASADGDRYALPVHILLLKSFRPSFILHTGSATGKSVADEPVADKPVEERPTEKEHVAGEPTGETKSGSATIDIIDDFIDKGEHKVVATDDTPEFIPENTFEGIPEDDELITEELAEVYLNQGLFDQAKSIYKRLSLLYPKKSVYFAEIIEKADHGKCAAENNKNKKTIK